jgi:hypothetical protein
LATNWNRISELDHLDSLGVEAVERVAEEIRRSVQDRTLYDSVVLKVARAVVERKISPSRVGEICNAIVAGRKLPKDDSRRIRSPSKYFCIAAMQEFKAMGVPWHARDRSDDA